ncbi:MAG TPA: NAD(P)H-dependent oxidoreductase [Caulobacteraceae bacterium]|nr:NAD(P)H-dependent oxidoreductase [Caulobacteraceae bacterium]
MLVLLGSARPDGNTADTTRELIAALKLPAMMIDLGAATIEPFDYVTSEHPDTFVEMVRRALEATDLVLATPVYWYAMSGVMKRFFDRLTDLVREPNKTLGRALAGRTVWLVATGTDPELPAGFELPFRLTAGYFGMAFGGTCYRHYLRDSEPVESAAERIRTFAADIEAAKVTEIPARAN